jgi:thioesterase domain-containing protein
MPVYGGDAVYFRTATGPKSMDHPERQDSWDQIIKGRLTQIPASGRHWHIMSKANVPSLARNLTKELERARGEARLSRKPRTDTEILLPAQSDKQVTSSG